MLDFEQLFAQVNQTNHFLVIKDELKQSFLSLKSKLEVSNREIYFFKIITESELIDLFSFVVDSNLYLNELDQHGFIKTIADKIKFSRYNFNYLKEFSDFVEVNSCYFKKNTNFLSSIDKFQFTCLLDTIYLDKFFEYYQIQPNLVEINYNSIPKVYEFNHVTEELVYLFEKIADLVTKGVSLGQIYLVGVNQSNHLKIKELSNDYQLPVNLESLISFYDYPYAKQLLKMKLEDLISHLSVPTEEEDEMMINEEIISILNSIDFHKYQPSSVNKFLKEQLKNKKIKTKQLTNGVTVMKIEETIFLNPTDYVFVINASFNAFPALLKNNDYLSDYQKELIGYPTSSLINQTNHQLFQKLLQQPQVKYVSYAIKDDYREYVASDVLLSFKVNRQTILITDIKQNFAPKIYQGLFSNHDPKNELLTTFDNSLSLDEKTKEIITSSLKQQNYQLSASHLIKYLKSPFIFYLDNILKLVIFEDNLSSLMGNFFHGLMELLFRVKEESKTVFSVSQRNNFISDLTFEFDSSSDLTIIYQQFVLEFMTTLITEYTDRDHLNETKELLILLKFYLQRDQSLLINNAERMLELAAVDQSTQLLLEYETKLKHFKGIVDLILIKDKHYTLIDYKSSKKDSFSLEHLNQLLDDLVTANPVKISNLDFLQILFYVYLINSSTELTLSSAGFFAFREKGGPLLINAFFNEQVNPKLKRFYTVKETRNLHQLELIEVLNQMESLAKRVYNQILAADFDNQVLVSKDSKIKLEQTDFKAYQALAFYTRYAAEEDEHED